MVDNAGLMNNEWLMVDNHPDTAQSGREWWLLVWTVMSDGG